MGYLFCQAPNFVTKSLESPNSSSHSFGYVRALLQKKLYLPSPLLPQHPPAPRTICPLPQTRVHYSAPRVLLLLRCGVTYPKSCRTPYPGSVQRPSPTRKLRMKLYLHRAPPRIGHNQSERSRALQCAPVNFTNSSPVRMSLIYNNSRRQSAKTSTTQTRPGLDTDLACPKTLGTRPIAKTCVEPELSHPCSTRALWGGFASACPNAR